MAKKAIDSSKVDPFKKSKPKSPTNAKSKKSAKDIPNPNPPKGMSKDKYERLVAEAKAPYKGFRKVIYGAVGASGAVGGFVFFTQILAGRDLANAVPNLAVQLGVIGIVIFLFRWEDRDKRNG